MIIHRTIAAIAILAALPAASPSPPGAVDWASARPINVQLSSFAFDPATITLQSGQPYDLHFTNDSSGGHDFAAKAFFAAAQVMEADRAKIAAGKVEIEGGQSVDVHLVAPPPGTYKVRCTHFMHSAFGMSGEIVVR